MDSKRNGMPTREELTGALAVVRRQIHYLQGTAETLESALSGSDSAKGVEPIPLASPAPRRRRVSAATRIKMSIGQKNRWAGYRAATAETPKTGEPTKPISWPWNEREQKVLRGILDGLTNSRIAEGMGISVTYVKAIIQGLFNRTRVRTRNQLVRLALEGSLGNLGNGDPVAEQPVPPESPLRAKFYPSTF